MSDDEPQGTMGRVQMEGLDRCPLPAFFCAPIFIESETSGYKAGMSEEREETAVFAGYKSMNEYQAWESSLSLSFYLIRWLSAMRSRTPVA